MIKYTAFNTYQTIVTYIISRQIGENNILASNNFVVLRNAVLTISSFLCNYEIWIITRFKIEEGWVFFE
jgi:formylmethanofuran dehydrogenase subunit A